MTPESRIYWDTNIFIMLREQSGACHELLWNILEALKNRARPFYTSLLTFSELKVKPLQNADADLVRTYEEWPVSSQWLDVLPVEKPVLEGAAVLRAGSKGLKLPDAIHVATALHVRCTYFLTSDMGIGSTEKLVHPIHGSLDITPLTVIRPDAPTLSSILQSLAA